MKKLRFAAIGIGHVHTGSMIRDFLDQGEERVEFLGFADYPYHSPEESEHLKMNHFQREDGSFVYPYFENYHDILAMKPDLVILCADICAENHQIRLHCQNIVIIFKIGVNEGAVLSLKMVHFEMLALLGRMIRIIGKAEKFHAFLALIQKIADHASGVNVADADCGKTKLFHGSILS